MRDASIKRRGAEDCQEPPKAGRDEEGASPRGFRESRALLTA